MANGNQFNDLDFENLIAGPLTAVIKAQAESALTTVDFIRQVGFEPASKTGTDKSLKPVKAVFEYDKPMITAEGELSGTQRFQLAVPFLAMLPIPSLRVEEVTIEFNAKITDVQREYSASLHDLNAEAGAKARWGWGSAKIKANYAYKRRKSEVQQSEATYSMMVRVRAVQDEIPAGTERLLGILESVMVETPVRTP